MNKEHLTVCVTVLFAFK